AYPNKPLHGVIDQVSEVLDPTNKTLRVRIKLPNPDLMLRPEMYAKVIVTNKENRQSLYVPNKSIVSLNGKNYVIVFHSNTDMKIVEVNVLKSKDNKTYVTGNIQPGDKIITKNELLIFQQLLNETE
ncbi:MAG TPA: efflux RND transporter periplasmic adaptor subunit, partial [Sediminibacterium sp.]|nr:efflux RND transporter periplasmic adaptor subunit [Sediminibacterium sp.]